MMSQSLTCDNSLGINFIEARLWEADHTAIGVLYIWFARINLPTPSAILSLYWQQRVCTDVIARSVLLHK